MQKGESKEGLKANEKEKGEKQGRDKKMYTNTNTQT